MSNADKQTRVPRGYFYKRNFIVSLALVVVFVILTVVGYLILSMPLTIVGAAGVGACAFYMGRFSKSPDRIAADQTNRVLELSNDTLKFMQEGLNPESATEVCNILLPAMDAASVALYDEDTVLGHAGYDDLWENGGDPIRISYAKKRFENGAKYVIRAEELEDDEMPTEIKASIISPLKIQDRIVGAIKIYYTKEQHIGATQIATCTGFAMLLSTQLALSELEEKTELAAKMELRALQAQINPHFLFNTINTIASMIRTDPRQARILLREFAVFYRKTLENSQDLITLEQELTQTIRYLGFEKARFGDERIQLTKDVEPGLDQLKVPSFIVQPIVENAVGHAMRPGSTPLHIDVSARRQGDDVVIAIADDGVGMDTSQKDVAVKQGRSHGAGIALKNVNDRLKGCFGEGSGIRIESTLDVGTTVYLTLANAKVDETSVQDVPDQAEDQAAEAAGKDDMKILSEALEAQMQENKEVKVD